MKTAEEIKEEIKDLKRGLDNALKIENKDYYCFALANKIQALEWVQK